MYSNQQAILTGERLMLLIHFAQSIKVDHDKLF
jgi:hypothetical protein